jgi:hypothetical protein
MIDEEVNVNLRVCHMLERCAVWKTDNKHEVGIASLGLNNQQVYDKMY